MQRKLQHRLSSLSLWRNWANDPTFNCPLLRVSDAPFRFTPEELLVSAAASLTDALKEIGAKFEKESNTKVVFNFGASSMLARQIEKGAPADVFVSADEAQMRSVTK